jgi:hypothetical protein
MIVKQVIGMAEKGIELVEEISNIELYICGHEVVGHT